MNKRETDTEKERKEEIKELPQISSLKYNHFHR